MEQIYFSLGGVVVALVSVLIGYWMGARQTDRPLQTTVMDCVMPSKPPVPEPEGTIFDDVRGDNLT